MLKRWFIRIIVVLPLLLCVVGWVRSRMHDDTVGYAHALLHAEVDAYWGSIHVLWEQGTPRGSGPYYKQDRTFQTHFWPVDQPLQTYWGFGLHRVFVTGYTYVWVSFPYWFVTLVLAFVAVYAWWKTRRKPDPKTAFPIEVSKLQS